MAEFLMIGGRWPRATTVMGPTCAHDWQRQDSMESHLETRFLVRLRRMPECRCPSEDFLPTSEGTLETVLLLLSLPPLHRLMSPNPVRRQRAGLHFEVHSPYR